MLLYTDPVAELKVARSKIEELEKSVESYKKEVSVFGYAFVGVTLSCKRPRCTEVHVLHYAVGADEAEK